MYGSPQGALHKKVQLHIKNCSNYKLKNVAANQKMFLQIKKCCFKVHFQPCVKNMQWVSCFILVVGRKPAKNQSITQLVAFPYSC